MEEMLPITLDQLTEANVDGAGAFDVLMRATKGHLEQEYNKNRIKGGEYATVYLGSLEHVLRASLQFVLEKDKNLYEAELIKAQVLLAQAELAKTLVDTQRLEVEVLKAEAELAILQLNATKIPAEIALLNAQTVLTTQQTSNLVAEADNIPKQGLKLDAETALITQNKLNAVIEGTVLQAQKCKLDAEFDVLQAQKIKVAGETTLLTQKTATEKAQIAALGVEVDSVIGRQKALYKAQTDGFSRDAEQKTAEILAKTWNVRRTTDEGTTANSTNKLDDATIGRTINKMLQGIGA